MKKLAALLAVVSMCGCAFERIPTRADADEQKRGRAIVIVCIFASCRDIVKTPPPATSSLRGESATETSASRREPGARWQGIGPVGEFHAREIPEVTR